MRRRALALATLWAVAGLGGGLAVPSLATGQVFIASKAHPPFTVGPLFVRGSITPALDHTDVEVRFSLEMAANATPAQVAQDLYLMWPGEVRADMSEARRAERAAKREGGSGKGEGKKEGRRKRDVEIGAPDPELAKFVEARGYRVHTQGVLKLTTRDIYGGSDSETVVAGAPFVTFNRERAANGPTLLATWIRLPWRPEMVNRNHLMSIRFSSTELVKRQRATWIEETFRGRRNIVTLGFHDVRTRGIFPLYLEHRDRVVRLSEDPSQLTLTFREPDSLKLESVNPANATRRVTEGRQPSQLVSLFIDRSEGLAPQQLTVEFGYFSGIHSWMPILIPTLFFLLGNLAAVGVRVLGEKLSKHFAGRLLFGRRRTQPERESGIIVPREKLAQITPGETTFEQLMTILGASPEEQERLDGSGKRTLVYRGRRFLPRHKRSVGWLTTVSHWDAEDHEVEIMIDGDRVSDLNARIRRSRVQSPDAVPAAR